MISWIGKEMMGNYDKYLLRTIVPAPLVVFNKNNSFNSFNSWSFKYSSSSRLLPPYWGGSW